MVVIFVLDAFLAPAHSAQSRDFESPLDAYSDASDSEIEDSSPEEDSGIQEASSGPEEDSSESTEEDASESTEEDPSASDGSSSSDETSLSEAAIAEIAAELEVRDMLDSASFAFSLRAAPLEEESGTGLLDVSEFDRDVDRPPMLQGEESTTAIVRPKMAAPPHKRSFWRMRTVPALLVGTLLAALVLAGWATRAIARGSGVVRPKTRPEQQAAETSKVQPASGSAVQTAGGEAETTQGRMQAAGVTVGAAAGPAAQAMSPTEQNTAVDGSKT